MVGFGKRWETPAVKTAEKINKYSSCIVLSVFVSTNPDLDAFSALNGLKKRFEKDLHNKNQFFNRSGLFSFYCTKKGYFLLYT